jgi:hypothetical protein
MRGWHASAWTTIAIGMLAVSCGGGAEGGGPTTTGAVVDAPVSIEPIQPVPEGPVAGPPGSLPTSVRNGPNPPAITGFTAPPTLECTAGEHATVPVLYQTNGAMTVAFADGSETIMGAPPVTGGYNVPVSCDGKEHAIILMAIADDGSTSGEVKRVMVGAG